MADTPILPEDLDRLEASLAGAADMAAAFDTELKRIHETFSATGGGIARLEKSLTHGLGRAIDGVVLDGMRLSDALRLVATSLVDTAYRAAIKPVAQHMSGMLTAGIGQMFGGAFADGAAFSQGRVTAFAKGGVVNGPTGFAMRGGMGLMGEAGPEAILPLSRGADGRLGVRAGGGAAPITVVMNVTTPDVRGFQRSQSQIAAHVGRALGQGQRNR